MCNILIIDSGALFSNLIMVMFCYLSFDSITLNGFYPVFSHLVCKTCIIVRNVNASIVSSIVWCVFVHIIYFLLVFILCIPWHMILHIHR